MPNQGTTIKAGPVEFEQSRDLLFPFVIFENASSHFKPSKLQIQIDKGILAKILSASKYSHQSVEYLLRICRESKKSTRLLIAFLDALLSSTTGPRNLTALVTPAVSLMEKKMVDSRFCRRRHVRKDICMPYHRDIEGVCQRLSYSWVVAIALLAQLRRFAIKGANARNQGAGKVEVFPFSQVKFTEVSDAVPAITAFWIRSMSSSLDLREDISSGLPRALAT